jgi:hypothetical protein
LVGWLSIRVPLSDTLLVAPAEQKCEWKDCKVGEMKANSCNIPLSSLPLRFNPISPFRICRLLLKEAGVSFREMLLKIKTGRCMSVLVILSALSGLNPMAAQRTFKLWFRFLRCPPEMLVPFLREIHFEEVEDTTADGDESE